MTGGGTMGLLIKWDRKRSEPSLRGTPDHSVILHSRYLSGCWQELLAFAAMITYSSSHNLITHWLLTSSVLLTHIYVSLGKAASDVPSPKSKIPISNIKLDTFTANGSNYNICVPTVNSTCWLNTDAKYPFSTGINKIKITKQEPSLHPFLFFPTL